VDFLNEAKKIAERSSIRKHRTGVVFVRKNKIISNGWSHVPHYKLYGKRSLHAEMHALARGRRKNLSGAECWIVTLTRCGNSVNSLPCLDCAIALYTAGIYRVYWPSSNLAYNVFDINETTFADLKVYEQ